VGVSTTGELIEDDGRVYAGENLTGGVVSLPSLKQPGFEAVVAGIKANHEILTELGYFTLMDIDAVTSCRWLSANYLPLPWYPVSDKVSVWILFWRSC
jgi:hypothetical protein